MSVIEVRAARWVLPASLALNVFLGTLVGVGLVTRSNRPPPPPRPDRLIESMVAVVPPADAVILREIFSRVEPEINRLHQSRHENIDRVKRALGAAEIDEAALRALIQDIKQTNDAQDARMESAILEVARRLSAEGRRKLAQWSPSFGPGGRERGPEPGPFPPR